MPNNNPNKEDTPLIKAVNNNDKEEVERLLENGADVNESGDYCYTPLMWAVQIDVDYESSRKLDTDSKPLGGCDLDLVINTLIEDGVDAVIDKILGEEADEKIKDTIKAILEPQKSKLSIVKLLIGSGADVNAANSDKDTALILAVRKSRCDSEEDNTFFWGVRDRIYFEVVKLLIDNAADVNARGLFGNTALMCAVMNDNSKIVQCLLDHDAGVDRPNKDGDTPIMYAITNNNLEIVKRLIEKKANVNAKDNLGYSPLMFAVGCDNLDIVENLVVNGAKVNEQDDDGYTPLMNATGGNVEVVKFLIGKGANVNEKDMCDMTALIWASRENNVEVVKYLLEQGADVNAKSRSHDTALIIAVCCADIEIVEYLIDKGADVDAINRFGVSSLMLATMKGRKGIAELLIDKGADVNVKDNSGCTLLIKAVNAIDKCNRKTFLSEEYKTLFKNAVLDVVSLLIERDVDVNGKGKAGKTPLMHAVVNNDLETVEFLVVKKNADMDATDEGKKTALDIALLRKNTEIADFLREHGAKRGCDL